MVKRFEFDDSPEMEDVIEDFACEDDLNNELKNEQFNFYVKSELWFLRFINAKDKNNKFHQEIQEAKIKFIKNHIVYFNFL